MSKKIYTFEEACSRSGWYNYYGYNDGYPAILSFGDGTAVVLCSASGKSWTLRTTIPDFDVTMKYERICFNKNIDYDTISICIW